MATIKQLNIYINGNNKILKIPEYARYVGLTSNKFENDSFDYALSKERNSLIHVSEYQKNKDTVYCPICGQLVYAKLGSINKHSFSHYRDESCRGIESDAISEKSLNETEISKSSTNHSDLPKLKKFRYKISGQGLVNEIMQIKNNLEIQEHQEHNENNDSLENIISLINSIDFNQINDLNEFVEIIENKLNYVTEIREMLENKIDNLDDKVLLESGLQKASKYKMTLKGVNRFYD